MYETLIQHIHNFSSPSQQELDIFLAGLEEIKVKNKEYLLQEGQLCHYQHFVLQGCLRCFFVNKKGTDKIINFAIENWWITDLDSFFSNKTTQLNIQAIEDSTILRISFDDLERILEKSLEINRYFRKIHERVRIADQNRIQYMFELSGKELYDMFCSANPDFVQRVPQYMLASYLDLTPEFISKIRRTK